MAASNKDLIVKVGADVSSLKEQFTTAQGAVDKSLTDIIGKLDQLSQTAKKAEDDTKKAGQGMSSSFSGAASGMAGSIGGLITKLAGLAAAFLSVQAVIGGFQSTVGVLQQVDEIAQNMGVSAEKASAYRQAMLSLDISLDQFSAAQGKVTKIMSTNQGMFEKWGVNIRDANGNLKDQEGVMQAVLGRVAQYKDGSDRAAAAQKLLGVDLDTANKLIMLNAENLQAGSDAAKQFGTEVSGNQLSALQDYEMSMADLNNAIDGLKLAFFSDLIPAVSAFVDFISQNAPSAIDFLKKAASMVIQVFEDVWDICAIVWDGLGEIMSNFFSQSGQQSLDWSAVLNTAADIVKGVVIIIVGTFKIMSAQITLAAEIVGIAVGAIIQSFIDLKNFDTAAVGRNFDVAMQMVEESAQRAATNVAKSIAKIQTDLKNLANGVNVTPVINPFTPSDKPPRETPYVTTPPAGSVNVTTENQRGGGKKGGGDEASRLIKAQTDLIKAELQAQLDLLKEKNRQEKNLLEEQLDDNIISYKEYYARINEMAKAESQMQIRIKEEELASLQKLQKTAKNESDRITLQAQMVKIQNEIIILKQKELEIDRESARELKKKTEEMAKLRIDLLQEASQLSGKMDIEAEFAALEEQYRETKARLTAEGDSIGLGALEKILQYKRAKIQIDAFEQDFKLLETKMNTKQIELEQRARQTGMTDATLQREKLKLQREEIDNLIEIKNRQLEVAMASFGANSQQVADIQGTIANLKLLKTETNEFAKGVKESMGSAFTTLFEDMMNGTKSVKDMFKDFVNNIVQQINRLVAEMLSKRLMGAIEGMMGGGSRGGGFGFGGGGGGMGGIFSAFSSMGAGGGGGGGFWSSFAGILGGRANGGFTASNKPYMIGENGPEIFVPRTSGEVINNRDLRQMGFNSRPTQPLVVNITTPDPHAFRKTQQQTFAELSKTVNRANNRNN